ncbi:MAG: RtcB family protein [Elusimicrobiales bacterium]|nr:RtcB family protein [Elusimicrobiales bacterium]
MKRKLRRLDDWRLELPAGSRPGMSVPAVIYADAAVERTLDDKVLEQAANTACLPGIRRAALVMPDAHAGYGFPIGGVAALGLSDGVISPGGVGYDINCGVRLLSTAVPADRVRAESGAVSAALFAGVPAGVGSESSIRLSKTDEKAVAEKGARWAAERGMGEEGDLERCESGGRLDDAEYGALSRRALERGRRQLGTLGSGNHFVEIQEVAEILDPSSAAAFGLEKGMAVVMVHSGSRGLGHQVCADSIDEMLAAARRYGITLPDRELACAPCSSPEAERYLAAMRAAANYAWANRQVLGWTAGKALAAALKLSLRELGLRLVYDVAHNIAKVEEHAGPGGRAEKLMVHRKGATRAFPPGHPEVPEEYRAAGQPVIIPGDMGRESLVLAGSGAMGETFGSVCHGAGRLMSRGEASRRARGRDITGELAGSGVSVMAAARGTLGEEMPEAYKDVSMVVRVVEGAGLARITARLRPVCVVKG